MRRWRYDFCGRLSATRVLPARQRKKTKNKKMAPSLRHFIGVPLARSQIKSPEDKVEQSNYDYPKLQKEAILQGALSLISTR